MVQNQKRFPAPSESVVALILAGGQSRRLFPFNKVLSDLTGKGRTLIQQAYDRSTAKASSMRQGLVHPRDFFVLSDPSFVPTMRAQLKLPANQFLSDPVRRGTWPAILWAMAHLRSRGPDTVLTVMTADHLIGDLPRFRRAMAQAVQTARAQPAFVTVGVSPTRRPEDWRGFGALRSSKGSPKSLGQPILQFEEKPSLGRAAEMIQEKQWLWNAGMFFFRLGTAEKALAHFQLAMAKTYERVCQAIANGDQAKAVKEYETFPMHIAHPTESQRQVDNTIDYAIITPMVMSPTEGLSAWSASTSLKNWADVGEWTVLKTLVKPDQSGNTVVGKVVGTRDVKKCLLVADAGRQIEISGAQDLVVAFSGEKALVLPIADVPRLKEVLSLYPDSKLVAHGVDTLDVQIRGHRLIVRPKTL